MSEILDILTDTVSERAPVFGDRIKNLTTGEWFNAEIETKLDPFLLPAELADDPREKIRLHILDDKAAAALNRMDKIQFMRGPIVCTFKIVSGMVSPASIQNQFLAIHLVDGKDQ